MNIKEIYVFGIHRSGTNYLLSLLNKNFKKIIHANSDGNYTPLWKHSVVVDSQIGNYPTFVIFKDPYTWVESIIKRRVDDGHNIMLASVYLPHYVDTNRYIKSDYDYKYYNNKISLERLLNIYRQFYENWMLNFPQEKQENLFIISYEDLLIEEKRINILEKIAKKYGWVLPDKWVNADAGTIPLSKEYTDDMAKYYLERKPTELTKEEVLMIDNIIDIDFRTKLKEKVKEFYV